MKFWFSVVPTLPFTSLDNDCVMGSPLDHPELLWIIPSWMRVHRARSISLPGTSKVLVSLKSL
uniref:Uncharacterized protein n=1 Tax=Lepeophtheirus salmonis TaxID=72036 RepID=A0A0K2V230_LEPSM